MVIMIYKLFIYGLPGAGKDTQMAAISEALGIPQFSAGQIMREEAAAGTELGERVRPYLETGTMAPGAVATGIFRDKLSSAELQASGYIVNGYPRTLESFQTYLTYDRPTALIHISVPDDVARTRLLGRARADDTPELIETRIKRYHEMEKKVCEYAKVSTDIPVIEVDGLLPQQEITKLILDRLKVA